MKKLREIKNKMRFTIHPAFLLVFIYCAIFGGVNTLLMISALALLHECGHALVAKRYGYKLKKMRLLPFGAELYGDDLFLPNHEIKIALAGPLTNIFICIVCVAFMWLFPGIYYILNEIFYCSMTLAIFNLLPFFPLDGGRVFLALISKKIERAKCLKLSKIFTFCFGIMLLTLFIISIFFTLNISFLVMGISLIFICLLPEKSATYQRVSSKEFKRKKLESGLEIRQVNILGSASVLTAFGKIDARYYTQFYVVKEDFTILGYLTETELENLALHFGHAATLEKLVLAKKLLTNQ